MGRWVLINLARVAFTLLGVFTIQRLMPGSAPFGQLLICTIIAIIGIRLWMPWSKDE